MIHFKGDVISNPQIFAAPDVQLSWVKKYCKVQNPTSRIGIDMTYKIGPYYVTTTTMPMPIFVLKDHRNKHPHALIGLSITSCKQQDYLFLARNLKTEGKIDSLIYGTDGEVAIEKAFEEVFPINGNILLKYIRYRIKYLFTMFF